MGTMAIQAAVTHTYNDVRKLIFDTVYKFQAKHGGEFDELVSQANYYFVLAYENYNPNSASFVTWMRARVWFGLLDGLRQKGKEQRYLKKAEFFAKPNTTYCKMRFTETKSMMSSSAKELLEIILTIPYDIPLIVPENKEEQFQMKVLIATYLRKIGWSGRRIEETFEEIYKVVND